MLDSAIAMAATEPLPSRRSTLVGRVARFLSDITRTAIVIYSRPANACTHMRTTGHSIVGRAPEKPPWHYSTGFLVIGVHGGPRFINGSCPHGSTGADKIAIDEDLL